MKKRKFKIREIKAIAKEALYHNWIKMMVIYLLYAIIAIVVPNVLSRCADEIWNVSEGLSLAISIGVIVYMILISAAMYVGGCALPLKIIRREKINFMTIFDGFRCPLAASTAAILIAIFSILWYMLSFVPSLLLTAAGVFFSGVPFEELIYLPGTVASAPQYYIHMFSECETTGLYLFGAAVIVGILAVILVAIFLYRYSMTFYVLADREERISGVHAINESIRITKKHRFKLFCLYLSFIGWYLLMLLAISAGVVLLMLITSDLFSLNTGISLAMFIALIAIAIGCFIGAIALAVYLNTCVAVYYSIYSGNITVIDENDEENVKHLTEEDIKQIADSPEVNWETASDTSSDSSPDEIPAEPAETTEDYSVPAGSSEDAPVSEMPSSDVTDAELPVSSETNDSAANEVTAEAEVSDNVENTDNSTSSADQPDQPTA